MPGLFAHAQDSGQRLGDQLIVGQRRELYQPDTVRVTFL